MAQLLDSLIWVTHFTHSHTNRNSISGILLVVLLFYLSTRVIILVPPKIRDLPSVTLSQSLQLENFATANGSCCQHDSTMAMLHPGFSHINECENMPDLESTWES